MSFDPTKQAAHHGSFAASLGESVEDTFRRYYSASRGSDERHATQDLVRHFMVMFGYDVADKPTRRTWRELMFTDGLFSEEVDELRHELGRAQPDVAKIAHEAADVMYVLYVLANECGFDLDACVREVHRANMTKQAPPDKMHKTTKGEHFVPANVDAVVHGS